MNSLILSTALRLLVPLFLVFALFLLFQGHNAPGGGFIAGLLTATIFILHAMNYGVAYTVKKFRLRPLFLIALGLLVAIVAGLLPLIIGQPFLHGLWTDLDIPLIGKPGTPLMFDIGVYLTVTGIMLKIIFSLWKGHTD